MKKGKLYLIPSQLGDSEINRVLPAFNLELLQQLNIFIVEDVRTARRFLRKAGFDKDFEEVTFHILNEHTQEMEFPLYLQEAHNGKDIGLLSEAGLPCIADPGNNIVSLAHQQEIEVIPLVGPSSLLLALMASGFNGQNFAFVGYLPIKQIERKTKLKELEKKIRTENQTQIFIEAPYRNIQLFSGILEYCLPDTQLCIACDLTLPTQLILTKTISNWKNHTPDINKRPTVFLLF